MVRLRSPSGNGVTSSGDSEEGGAQEKVEKASFAIAGSTLFTPNIHPETIRVRKVRNLNRTQNHCKNEDVSDDGAENREIHVSGRVTGLERGQLDDLAESSDALALASSTWTGEVRVSEVEYDGPTGWDPTSGYYYYDYTLDLVATGPPESPEGNGIISNGDDN